MLVLQLLHQQPHLHQLGIAQQLSMDQYHKDIRHHQQINLDISVAVIGLFVVHLDIHMPIQFMHVLQRQQLLLQQLPLLQLQHLLLPLLPPLQHQQLLPLLLLLLQAVQRVVVVGHSVFLDYIDTEPVHLQTVPLVRNMVDVNMLYF
jgi:hypothetical protein